MFRTLHIKFILGIILVVLTCVIYWQTGNHQFLYFDDNEYVVNNQHVNSGLTRDNIIWAFTGSHSANWHPLTWLSHMVDIELFGLDPRGHHLVNVALHAANSLLLFLLLNRITGFIWRSLFIAAIFALHPVHVESVAWIAERKDLLSGLFGLLTLICYANWSKRAGTGRYLLCLCCFILGLVTLPFVLLLLDYWPLNRLSVREGNRLILEKLPFFALSAMSCIITFLVQQQSAAVATLATLPFSLRLENAMLSYVGYIEKMFWPTKLAAFYPVVSPLSHWKVAVATLFIAALSVFVMRHSRQSQYLVTGWLWYLGMLVPVIGLVQVGEQAMADRYTYLPTIGLTTMIVWGVTETIEQWNHGRVFLIIAGSVAIFVMGGLTWQQTKFWRDTRTLFRHAAQVVPNNYLAEVALGSTLLDEGNFVEAIRYFDHALKLKPNQAIAHNNLALALAATGALESALVHYDMAIAINPRFPEAFYNKGVVMAGLQRFTESAAMLRIAISIRPDYSEAYNNLGCALIELGYPAAAAVEFKNALRLNPDLIDARKNLKLTQQGAGFTP